MASTISPGTVAAYEATNYRVLSDPPIVINIGQPNKLLGRLYEVYGCASAAFITAWNPFSAPTSTDANAAAQARFQEELGSQEALHSSTASVKTLRVNGRANRACSL